MQWRALGVSVVVMVSTAGFGLAQMQSRTEDVPVLAELFTSEGCNSCPPADGLLAILQQEQPIKGVYVVTLSEHVTYWDHQGWKDPFGSQQFTRRQQQYGLGFNLESNYTPQLVIDGARQMIGSDKRAIERALTEAAFTPKPPLHVTIADAGSTLNVSASGAGLTAEQGAELWFAVTEDNLVVDVKRGENANKTLRHTGVVRLLQSGGVIDSPTESASLKIGTDWRRENLRVVAFVQSRKNRKIVSIGYTPASR